MRFSRGLVAVLCVIGAAAGVTHADRTFKKGPYLQDVAPTAVTIMWETSGRKAASLHVVGPGVDRTIPLETARSQEVVVDGLAPSTRYAYDVTVDGVTERGELATSPEDGAQVPFTFVVYGDTRSNVDSHRRVVARVATEVPDFLLGTGDLVDSGGIAAQWQQFFEIEGELLRDNVLFPAVGNHDRQGRGRTADSWRAYFAVPENSPDPERYYAFTYGNARVIVLDSNMSSFALTDQTAWLEGQLQSARQSAGLRHIFVVMHHPPYSVSLHGGQRDLRERWTPLYEKYGVDAVFSGHDHVYSRGEKGGVYYFVSGGGGAPLYPRRQNASKLDREVVKYFERVNHFLRVQVYGDLVEVTAVRVDGSQIETTTWGEAPALEVVAPTVAATGAGVADVAAVEPARVVDAAPAVATARSRDRSIGLPLAVGMAVVVLAIGAGGLAARRRLRR